eukprot:SAG31_NODE_1882_length_7000_cov_3.469932_2_plen_489_part_00
MVLHGADSDIVWLQRDFGLYIVNLFDTGQASRVLNLPRYSLAYLYKKYCDVDADKQYQLADWRIRPLPAEMVKYAREDTHLLLYTYDRLGLDLKAAAPRDRPYQLLLDTHRRSADVARRLYQKPIYDERSYMKELARRIDTIGALGKVNERVFAQLHAWRDRIARQFDESWAYVLPSYMLLRIAEQLPLSEDSLAGCARPLPPLLAHHAKEIVLVIQQEVSECTAPSGLLVDDAVLRSSLVQRQVGEATAPGALSADELYRLAGDGLTVDQQRIFGNLATAKRSKPSTWFADSPKGRVVLWADDLDGFDEVGASDNGEAIAAANTAKLVASSFDNLLSSAAEAIAEAKAAAERAAAEAAEAAEQVAAKHSSKAVVESVTEYLGPGSSAVDKAAVDDPMAMPPSLAETFGLRSQMSRLGRSRSGSKKGRHKRRAEKHAKATAQSPGSENNAFSPNAARKKNKSKHDLAAPVQHFTASGVKEPHFVQKSA